MKPPTSIQNSIAKPFSTFFRLRFMFFLSFYIFPHYPEFCSKSAHFGGFSPANAFFFSVRHFSLNSFSFFHNTVY
jgi:hypothetical protein